MSDGDMQAFLHPRLPYGPYGPLINNVRQLYLPRMDGPPPVLPAVPTYLPTEGRQARRAELTYLPTGMISLRGELCNVKKNQTQCAATKERRK